MVPRCGVQERREASPCQTQNLNSMSIPPALPKPQLMTRDASEGVKSQTHAAPKFPEPIPRPSFHLQILYTVCGSLLFFLVFGEDEANRRNRLDIRNGIPGTGIALNRPLPWDDPGYNLKPPTGNQILKPRKVRLQERAEALKKQGATSPLHRPTPLSSWKMSSSKSESKHIVTTPPTPFDHD